MLTTIEFPVERWFDSDWPTTTQTIENAHTMAPACLVGLTGVAFIIWGGCPYVLSQGATTSFFKNIR